MLSQHGCRVLRRARPPDPISQNAPPNNGNIPPQKPTARYPSHPTSPYPIIPDITLAIPSQIPPYDRAWLLLKKRPLLHGTEKEEKFIAQQQWRHMLQYRMTTCHTDLRRVLIEKGFTQIQIEGAGDCAFISIMAGHEIKPEDCVAISAANRVLIRDLRSQVCTCIITCGVCVSSYIYI